MYIEVYDGVMARTNLDLDEALVAEAMRRYGLPSKRAAVDFALRQLLGRAMTRDEALALEGSGWAADLDELRAGDAAALE
jgi:Arc/MetJ family transcription regulator